MESHCFANKRTIHLYFQVLCVLIVISSSVVTAFNVDKVNFVRYRGPQKSMFGFSVAGYRSGGNRWVLVGAPTANTAQPKVERGGAVYRCDTYRDDECHEIPFDRSGNIFNSSGSQIDQKSHQWFGASVYSAADGSAVVACAPRYVFYPPGLVHPRENPVGTCYVARDYFQRFSEYSPCRTSDWGYHRQGSCQAGLGVAISKDGRHLFIGAPGSWFWQGQLYTQSLHKRPEVYATDESSMEDDDTYLGYSVAVGDFAGDGTSSVAVGRPRGNQLVGTVLLYTWDVNLIGQIIGDQLGAYFGYSLCSSDLDGDSLDDLVVGTPLHTDLQNNEGKYETGRIYVFYQKGGFELNHTRDGKNSKSRFGLSVASFGDLNKDTYGDIVVGAPYDGPNEKGAVYIYMGSQNGILEKYSQIILAEDFSNHINTFGFSVSAGLDLDDNEYPDLVVGAYDANTAYFLRSRSVVKMNADIYFNTESKQINSDDFNCTLLSKAETVCTSLNVCLEYSGIGVDKELGVEVKVILDSSKPKSPRMFFWDNETLNAKNFTFDLTKNSLRCETIKVFIQPGIRDKLTPLDAEMRYSLRSHGSSSISGATGRRRFSRQLPPILDELKEPMDKDTLHIYKDCGIDNICIPDLQLTVIPSVREYLLGSEDEFKLEVIIANKGEDAFEAGFDLRIPLGINYNNITRLDGHRQDIPMHCSLPSPATNTTIKCDIGNPFPGKKHVHFEVNTMPFYAQDLRSQYDFFMEVYSSNPENESTINNNRMRLEIPISIEADVAVTGISIPDEVYWSSDEYTKDKYEHEEDIGPSLTYLYSIDNKGPADIVEAEVYFLVPTHTFSGDNILYLLEQPITSGPIECQNVPDVNYLHLTLEKRKSSTYSEIQSRKDFHGSVSATENENKTVTESGMIHEGNQHISRVGGGSVDGGVGSEHTHGHHGEISGGTRTIHNDERYIVTDESSLGEGIRRTSHQTHYYSNQSTSSNWSGSHGSESGGVSTLTTNKWNESGRPYHQFSNFSTYNSSYSKENGRHNNGRGHASSSSQSNGTRGVTVNFTSSGSTRVDTGDNRYSGMDNDYGSQTSQGVFHHYSKDWSRMGGNRQGGTGQTGQTSSGTGQQVHHHWSSSGDVMGKDNDGEGGHTRISGHEYNWSNRGSNDGQTHHYNSKGQSDVRTSTNWEGDDNGNTYYHGSVRGQYDSRSSSKPNIRQYTSENWNKNDADLSWKQGYGYTDSSQYKANSRPENHDKEYGETHGHSRGNIQKYTTSFSWNHDNQNQNPDLSFAARGPQFSGNENHHRITENSRVTSHKYSSSTWDSDSDGAEGYDSTSYRHPEDIYTSHSGNSDKYASQNSKQHTSSVSYNKNENVDGGKLKLYERYRRNAEVEVFEDLLKCNATNCTMISCLMGPLTKGEGVRIELRTRVWIPTMKKVSGKSRVVKTSSLMAMQVTNLPYTGAPSKPILGKEEVFTDIKLTDSPVKPDVPLWVVVLSAVAGAIILLLLVYLLWKCGFFKRNRPSHAPEKEPLNRNGHYSAGDEAL